MIFHFYYTIGFSTIVGEYLCDLLTFFEQSSEVLIILFRYEIKTPEHKVPVFKDIPIDKTLSSYIDFLLAN